MTFPICPVCAHPVRKRNRTVHVSCAPSLMVPEPEPSAPVGTGRECCFCHSRDTQMVNGAPFCFDHLPDDERTRVRSRTLTQVPDRCPRCDEPITPKATKGNIKCRCDQPKMPRHLRNNDADDRPPTQVRYGN